MKLAQLIGLISRTLLRIGVWVTTAAVLLLCVLFGRLFVAPVNLDFASETLEEQAADFLPGWQVYYGTAQIGWDWSAVRPWVLLEDLELIDRRNRLNASIQEARIVLSADAIFSGGGPTTVDIRSAHVNVTDLGGFSDQTDDSLFDELFSGGLPKPEVFKPVTEAFSRFTTRLLQNAPDLVALTFQNVSVDIARGESFSVFSVTAPSFRLMRQDESLSLSAQLDASLANTPTRIRLVGTAEPAVGELGLSLAFNDLSPSSLAENIDLPEIFSALRLPFGLDLQLDMTSEEGLRVAAMDISIGEGELRHPVQFPDGSPIDYGLISASYDVEKHLLTFGDIELSLNGNQVSGEGIMFWQDGYQKPGLRFQLGIDEVTIEDAQKYWPIKVHPDGRHRGARAWVSQHMAKGVAKNIEFDVNLEPDGSSPYKNGSFFELRFDVEDVDTKYLQTMKPILGASGTALLTLTEFDVFLNAGEIEGIPVSGSKAHLYDIHMPGKGIGEFEIMLDGDVREILGLIRVPPVRIAERVKVDLDRIGGDAKIKAKIELPLIKGAPKEAILYDVTADISNGRLHDLLGGEGLEDADVNFNVNVNELTAAGRGKINGVEMDLYWRENFAAGRHDLTSDTSLLVMSGLADQDDLNQLGVQVSDYLDGKLRAEATFLGRNLGFRIGYFSADASDAILKVPQIAWKKEKAVPANINGTVIFDEAGTRIEPLTLTGENLQATARIQWLGQNREDFNAVFNAPTLGRSSLTASVESRNQQPVKAKMTAEVLDLADLLRTKEERREVSSAPVSAEEGSSFDLDMTAEKALMMNGASLSDVQLTLSFRDNEPKVLELTGETERGQTQVKVSPTDDKMAPILVNSSDGGNLLRGLGLFAHMEGGLLALAGETSGWGDRLELSGMLKVSDSTLIAKNRLGPDVDEGVITGLDEYLDGGTLDLDVVEMPFNYQNQLLDLSGVKANGPSLGMTMEGQIDAAEGKINVNGVVVPAYGLNSLLGKIPLVGGLFSGGDGKGLFGVTYRVKGFTEKPEVSVNPLSGIAPGFLRLLFEGRKGTVDEVEGIAPGSEESVPESTEDSPEPTDGETVPN